MKLSVIIPCHPSSRPTLPRTLRSLETASSGLDVETLVVDDLESRGLSWARNRGLDRATGDIVFFVDADDTVKPDYFRRLSSLLVATEADFVLTSTDYAPLKRDYTAVGNAAVRAALLPAFFGYSAEDVRRWNAGGDLMLLREQGGVWRCAFRRAFLDRHGIRFDERLRVFEDAPFIAECACFAERVASADDRLYEYAPGPGGILANYRRSGLYWDYKFAALENRLGIARRAGGDVMRHFSASAVFSALELFRGRREWRRYVSDPFVARALRDFPLSVRHPLVAGAVLALRALTPRP